MCIRDRVMGIGGICLTVYLLWLLLTMPQSPLVPVLSVIVLFLSLAASFSREKLLYHLPAREKELAEQQRDYIEYLAGIRAVLIKHGIDGSEKLRKLKAECETLLKAREEKYARFHRVITDMLISVPVAALITGLIYQEMCIRDSLKIWRKRNWTNTCITEQVTTKILR